MHFLRLKFSFNLKFDYEVEFFAIFIGTNSILRKLEF